MGCDAVMGCAGAFLDEACDRGKNIGHFTEIPKDPLEDGPGFICASDGEICRCNGKAPGLKGR